MDSKQFYEMNERRKRKGLAELGTHNLKHIIDDIYELTEYPFYQYTIIGGVPGIRRTRFSSTWKGFS